MRGAGRIGGNTDVIRRFSSRRFLSVGVVKGSLTTYIREDSHGDYRARLRLCDQPLRVSQQDPENQPTVRKIEQCGLI